MPYELLLLSQLVKTNLDRKVLVVSDASPHIMANILLPDERRIPLKLVDMTVPKRSQPRVRRVGNALLTHDNALRAHLEKKRRFTNVNQIKRTVLNRILGKR